MSPRRRSRGVVRVYDDRRQHSGAVNASAQHAPLLPRRLARARDYLEPHRPAVEDGAVRLWVLQVDHLEGHLCVSATKIKDVLLLDFACVQIRTYVYTGWSVSHVLYKPSTAARGQCVPAKIAGEIGRYTVDLTKPYSCSATTFSSFP